jgi:DNA-binding LacI/PurR family transcriptional regulator
LARGVDKEAEIDYNWVVIDFNNERRVGLMPVTIKDVARRAGVSAATVSRVLAGKTIVSQELRERVLAAAEELEYQPSRVARSLRVQRSRIIGLIISDIQNPFFTALVRAVEDVAYQNDYGVFLCNSDEDIQKERFYIELLHAEKVAGVVISATQEEDNPSRMLVEAGIPMVAVDRRMRDLEVDTVVIDNREAARELVSHLISDGHRRIGAVVGPSVTTTGRERREGYLQALKEHDLPVVSRLVRAGPPKAEFGYRSAGELLGLIEPPSAIFTGNNLLTSGALRAIRERRLRIPSDIGLAAFDELDWMSLVQPGLTVVAQPTYELGRVAAELLLERIEDRARPVREFVLEPILVIRQSCARHES